MVSKNIIDYMSEEDYKRYNELLDKATEAKANRPKAVRAPKGPMTQEQKIAMAQKRLAAAQAKLDAMLASMEG